MKAKATALMLADLGVVKSHSRPHTPNENPFSEAHFKTLKYQPEFPKRFETINEVRTFCRRLAAWYNEDHHHSGIGFMTPDPIHFGQADTIHAARQTALDAAFPSTPRAISPQTPEPTTNPDSCLEQPAKPNGASPSLNPKPRCLKIVDTFRNEVPTGVFHQPLDAAVRHWARTNGAFNGSLVALARPPIPIPEQMMRLQGAEQRGALVRPVRQDLRDQAAVRRGNDPPDRFLIRLTVMERRLRHPAEEGKGMDMAIHLLPGR